MVEIDISTIAFEGQSECSALAHDIRVPLKDLFVGNSPWNTFLVELV